MVKKYTPHMAAPTGKPGAPVKVASGSKTVTVGAPNTTSAKMIKKGVPHAAAGKRAGPYTTLAMAAKQQAAAEAQKNRSGRVLTPQSLANAKARKKPTI